MKDVMKSDYRNGPISGFRKNAFQKLELIVIDICELQSKTEPIKDVRNFTRKPQTLAIRTCKFESDRFTFTILRDRFDVTPPKTEIAYPRGSATG